MSPKGLDIKFGLNYLNTIKNTKNELSMKSNALSGQSSVMGKLDSEGNRVIDDFSSESEHSLEEEERKLDHSHSTFKSDSSRHS